MLLTKESVMECCAGILNNIGVDGGEQERYFGIYIHVATQVYSGYGLEIYRANYVDSDNILITYDKKTVFASESGVFNHGDWEEVLYELSLKAPEMAAVRKARMEERRREEEEWGEISNCLTKSPNFLPMKEIDYSIAPGNSGITTMEYADDVVRVVQTKSGSSWSGRSSAVKIYVAETFVKKHWYGNKTKRYWKLVFDGWRNKEAFVDGYWRYHLMELVEAEKRLGR